ncbi:uncharacterized protein P174DRAFT_418666 [Aspergillus novofumigatus IBT 16806]|uniref:Uncharacterized protein n=1 Tax=Aspergillus novofumigatus (strain IBT 16806) TaxID=1392255 RepID=A0A2I1CJD0_ASPN1|nr:uncharacterized protein P174DRAFT_418666 [Aspergillus novofumigatus IBT 16806]PKX97726.1 hypothetical protein P174DRAFT_418666 [Aspergillus novofumigatus IBT 16806]
MVYEGCGIVAVAGDQDDLIYLNHARKLSLSGNVLFEHADLQQAQVELRSISSLRARWTAPSNIPGWRSALRSPSVVNLRLIYYRVHHASKEARSRLWWSIYLFPS